MAQRQLGGTIGGDYLYGGAGFDAAQDAASRQIMPQIDSKFSGSGRYGSGLHAQATAQALGDSFAKQYGDERTNQMRSMMFAPQMAELDYSDIARLASVGAAREGLADKYLGEAVNKHYEGQQAYYDRLAAQSAAIQGGGVVPGSSSSTTTTDKGGGGFNFGNALRGAGALYNFSPYLFGGTGLGVGGMGPPAALAGSALAPWALGAGLLAGFLG